MHVKLSHSGDDIVSAVETFKQEAHHLLEARRSATPLNSKTLPRYRYEKTFPHCTRLKCKGNLVVLGQTVLVIERSGFASDDDEQRIMRLS